MPLPASQLRRSPAPSPLRSCSSASSSSSSPAVESPLSQQLLLQQQQHQRDHSPLSRVVDGSPSRSLLNALDGVALRGRSQTWSGPRSRSQHPNSSMMPAITETKEPAPAAAEEGESTSISPMDRVRAFSLPQRGRPSALMYFHRLPAFSSDA